MGKKRKNQAGYTQGIDSRGRTTWVKQPQAASSASDSAYSVSDDILADGTSDISSDTIKEFLNDMDKEERDAPEYDDVRNQLLHSLSQDNASTIDAQSVAHTVSEPDSGATVDMINKVPITSGFAYSPYPERSQGVHVSKLAKEDIDNYVEKNMDILSREGNFLGVWHDPDDGTVYLDISVVSDDAHQARQGCVDNDQIAFFDMQMMESVVVDQDATSGGAKSD